MQPNIQNKDLVVEKGEQVYTLKRKCSNNYTRNDSLQKSLNMKAVKRWSELITEHYKKVNKPLSIVDFCCGSGEPTIELFSQLLQNKVEIESMIGYDILDVALDEARQASHEGTKLRFQKKNLEEEFNDVEQYDVVVALFGLHCMHDLGKVVGSIYRSLKPGGLLLSLTPLQVKDLLQMRSRFMLNSRWKTCFTGETSKVHAYRLSEEQYLKQFSRFFVCQFQEKQVTKFEYNQLQLMNLLQSWCQQVSDLLGEEKNEVKRDVISKAYLSEFVDSIPLNLSGSITKRRNGAINFIQEVYQYEGVKKSE